MGKKGKSPEVRKRNVETNGNNSQKQEVKPEAKQQPTQTIDQQQKVQAFGLNFNNKQVLNSFVMTAILLVVVPIGTFFIAKTQFKEMGFTEGDSLTYAGGVSVVFIQIISIIYCCTAINDKNNYQYEQGQASGISQQLKDEIAKKKLREAYQESLNEHDPKKHKKEEERLEKLKKEKFEKMKEEVKKAEAERVAVLKEKETSQKKQESKKVEEVTQKTPEAQKSKKQLKKEEQARKEEEAKKAEQKKDKKKKKAQKKEETEVKVETPQQEENNQVEQQQQDDDDGWQTAKPKKQSISKQSELEGGEKSKKPKQKKQKKVENNDKNVEQVQEDSEQSSEEEIDNQDEVDDGWNVASK